MCVTSHHVWPPGLIFIAYIVTQCLQDFTGCIPSHQAMNSMVHARILVVAEENICEDTVFVESLRELFFRTHNVHIIIRVHVLTACFDV